MSTTRYCQAGHRFDIDGTMAVGETIIVRVTPAQGYQFVSWSDGHTENPRQIYIDSCGEVYTARFTSSAPQPEGPYTITVKACPASAGEVTGGGTYDEGTEVQISVTPNGSAEFIQWNDGLHDLTRTITVTGNKTYTAEFEGCCSGHTWNITPPTSCFGTVSVKVNDEEVDTLTPCVPQPGKIEIEYHPTQNYEFFRFIRPNSMHDNNNPCTYTNIPNGLSISVQVRALIRTLDNGHGSVQQEAIQGTMATGTGEVTDGVGHYSKGQQFKLTAIPDTGYQFDHWELNNSTIQGGNPLTRTFDDQTCMGGTYKAVFTSTGPTLSYKWISTNATSDFENLSKYISDNRNQIVLGNSGFHQLNGFILPQNNNVTGSYKDGLGHTNTMTFTQINNPPVTVESGYKFMRFIAGSTDPTNYSEAKFIIN